MDNVIFKYSDFFNDDGGFKKTKEDFYKLSDDLIAKAKEVRKQTAIVSVDDSKKIDELLTKTKQLTDLRTKYNRVLSQLDQLQKKQVDGSKKVSKQITLESEALKKRNREARLVAKIQDTVSGSIENLRAKLSLVTVAWSKLSANELENTKRGQRLVESKKRLTEELTRLEKKTGDSRRQVGAYEKSLGKLRASFINVAQAAGVTLGIFGAFRLIRNSVTIVRDFEKQNATLAGVLQKTKSEISELTEDAKRLGSITVKTAGEVAQLQTEYARLGFTQKEIIDLTEPTINGSIALNSELSATAQLVGAIVNSYDDLSTTDAPQIIDVLSLATAKSALNFEKLNVALPIVSGAANAINVPLTEVTATLGKLADAGIETSTGATALRNIFIESSARGINYKDALEEITNSTDKLKTANDIFGKRAAVSALVIANNTEKVDELDSALQKAAGTAEEMAQKELNTLDGSIKLLTSAWEGFVLKMNDATNGGNILSSSIKFLAENLETIIKFTGIAATTYISYTLAIKATNLATKLGIVWTKGATLATNLKTAAITAATAAQKAFNTAAKSNPIGLIVALLASAVTAYYAFRDSATAAEKAQKRFNEIKKASSEDETKKIQEEKDAQLDRIKDLEYEIKLRKAKGEDSKRLDKEFIERKREILNEEIKNNQKIIDKEKEREKEFEKNLQERFKTIKNTFERSTGSIRSGGGETEQMFLQRVANAESRAIKKFEDQQAEITGVIETRNKKIAELNKQLSDIDKELTIQVEKNTKANKKAIQDRIKELELLRRRLEDLQDESIKNDEKREIQQTKRKFDREIKAIKGNSKIEIELREELERAKQRRINQIRTKYSNERLTLLKRGQEIERSLIEDDNQRQIEQERAKSKKIIDEIDNNSQLTLLKKLELRKKEKERLDRFEKDINNQTILRDLENAKLIEEARVEQRRNEFKTQEEYEEFKNNEFLKIQRKYLTKRLELLQSFNNDDFAVEIEQIKAELANLDVIPPSTDKWKEFVSEMKGLLTILSSEIEKSLSKSVEATKKSLTEQQKLVDIQRSRAEKGLTNTLAFEQKEQAKREAELIKRQKRLERIQKIKSYWDTYNANLNSLSDKQDSSVALAKTIRDIAIIETLTTSLTSFGDGGIVEDKLPSDGIFKGQSHKGNRGGVPIIVEGKEGILSTREMENLGKDNFYKLKHLASLGTVDRNFFTDQKKSFVTSITKVPSYDNKLVSEVREVKKAILSKPNQSLNVPEVVNGVLQFTETISQQNMKRNNHYKIKKPRL